MNSPPEGSRRSRIGATGVVIASLIVGQTQAATTVDTGPLATDAKSVLAVCASERAPLVERQKQYAELKKARVAAAFGGAAKAGLTALATGGLSLAAGQMGRSGGGGGGFPGLGGISGMGGGIPGMGGGGIPGMGGMPGMGAGGPAGMMGGDLSGVFSQALQLNVPGMGSAGNLNAGTGEGATRALLAISVVAAVGGAVDAYMKVKQQQYANDMRGMAAAIDGDAGTQLPVGSQTMGDVTKLADCRDRQLDDFSARLAAASNDKDRKSISRGERTLKTALKTDLDLSGEVVTHQATMVKTFTQGRAMAEGKSEYDILGNDAPAYGGEASRTVMSMAPAAPGAVAMPPPPPPPPSYVTARATQVRSAPNAKASVVLSFPAGRSVSPKGRAAADAGWWEIDVAGSPGFVRGLDLKVQGAGAGRQAGPPPLAPPNNIRTLNRTVLAAKTQGVDRLRTLNTDIQMGRLYQRTNGRPVGRG